MTAIKKTLRGLGWFFLLAVSIAFIAESHEGWAALIIAPFDVVHLTWEALTGGMGFTVAFWSWIGAIWVLMLSERMWLAERLAGSVSALPALYASGQTGKRLYGLPRPIYRHPRTILALTRTTSLDGMMTGSVIARLRGPHDQEPARSKDSPDLSPSRSHMGERLGSGKPRPIDQAQSSGVRLARRRVSCRISDTCGIQRIERRRRKQNPSSLGVVSTGGSPPVGTYSASSALGGSRMLACFQV